MSLESISRLELDVVADSLEKSSGGHCSLNVETGANSEAPLLVEISLAEWFLLLVDVGNPPFLGGLTCLLAEINSFILIVATGMNLENGTLSVREEFTSHVLDLLPS